MIFIEFISKDLRLIFVGKSYKDVLEDTNGGTEFGGFPLSAHHETSEEEVRELKNFPYLDAGIRSIKNGTSKSYYVGRKKGI